MTLTYMYTSKLQRYDLKNLLNGNELASDLSLQFSMKKNVQLKGRGCRKHLALLLKKYKEEDAKALKRWCVFVYASVGVFSS